MNKYFDRNTLGLAAEFAVASELCRRGIYAQLTLGHQKRTDILVFSEKGDLARIEVKSKQGSDWPNCKGIFGKNIFLVFVDYQDIQIGQRPVFYILSVNDWRTVLRKKVKEVLSKNPKRNIQITKYNTSVFTDQIGQNKKPYEGMGIKSTDLKKYLENWDTIIKAVG